ncbi:MAG: hypothetical protein WAK51_05545 [Opitutaceae bacterium]
MTKAAIIAAMPGELEPLVRGWARESRGGVDTWRHTGGEWIAACAGMGSEAAARAFAVAEKGCALDLVISAGWAGSLCGEFSTGSAFRMGEVVDGETGERFRTADPMGKGRIVTLKRVADRDTKRRLYAVHGPGLVDMEASAVARLAAKRGAAFFCVKGVSDGPDEQLPDFNCFISANGKLRWIRLVLFAVPRPWHWPALARMGGNSRRAALGLRESLLEILDKRITNQEARWSPKSQTPKTS